MIIMEWYYWVVITINAIILLINLYIAYKAKIADAIKELTDKEFSMEDIEAVAKLLGIGITATVKVLTLFGVKIPDAVDEIGDAIGGLGGTD